MLTCLCTLLNTAIPTGSDFHAIFLLIVIVKNWGAHNQHPFCNMIQQAPHDKMNFAVLTMKAISMLPCVTFVWTSATFWSLLLCTSILYRSYNIALPITLSLPCTAAMTIHNNKKSNCLWDSEWSVWGRKCLGALVV